MATVGKNDIFTNFADKPTEVKLGIYVNSFYSISEQTMVSFRSFEVCLSWIYSTILFRPTV